MFGGHEQRKHSTSGDFDKTSLILPLESLDNVDKTGHTRDSVIDRVLEICLLSPRIMVSGGTQHAVSKCTGQRL